MKPSQKQALEMTKGSVDQALFSLRAARARIHDQFDVSGLSSDRDDCTAAEIDRLIDGAIDQCMGVVSRIGRVR